MTKNQEESAKQEPPKKLEEIRIVKKEFSFELTTEDFAAKGKLIAQLSANLADAEADFDRAKTAFKSKESEIEAAIGHEVRCIRSKSELREVEVEQVHDYVRKIVYWRHGERIMGERTMELSERQAELPLAGKKPKDGGKGWDKLGEKDEPEA